MTVTEDTARRLANGNACCIGEYLCDKCKVYHSQQAAVPPNAYAAGIAALRAAAGTAEHHRLIAEQVAAIHREAAVVTAINDEVFRTADAMMMADDDSCAPPNPYAAGLAQMRSAR